MGPADHVDITGAKGGSSKPKTPVEAPDSLQSTNIGKILIAVGEGEFDEEPTDRDIYLDNTPIMDANGNVNFPGVKWEWRSGSVEQDYIQGIPAIENETTVNVELRSDNPFARALSNTQLSAVRVRMVWPRLAQQDSSGNTNGYRIEYAIDIATDGGAYVEAHLGAVDGKTTNGYQRSVRVNLPAATSGWMLRVRRITPNANSGTIADTMTIAGYTEIIDEKLRYPNTALLYIEFDAQQFQNIPAVTVKCKARRWPVPSNYDPIARTYTGVWDGTFKQAWTNNPAFVTYGVCVEDRFGLGKRIKSWMVDKWEMYRIAQYCDQQVPNGQGGQEPRFLCDMNLQGRAEAWTLLRDLSAIYRGMVYWAHGSLFMQADMPRAQDIDYVFTRANVIDGEFVYGGAERNTHYSRALVSYDNPANNYDTDVIPVTDLALQRRYRDRPVEISAIGCTRASEAQRRGKWALLSNSQDRTVTFKTGMEGRIPLPGYVIPVADELVAGRPNGGRISAAAGRVITLDRDTPIKAGDRLILNLPNGTAQARTVQSVAGRAVTVTTAYGVQPEPELQWAIDYDDLAVQLFRVLKTTRTQEGEYEITALEFNPSKFAAIDTGAKLDERPISVIPVTTVQPPASVTLSSAHMIDQGIAVSTMTIVWAAVEGAVAYDVEWRKENGNWVSLQRVGTTSVDVVGIYAGAYLARVRAVSAFDITSIWKSSVLTQLNGKEGLPPAVTFLDTESLLFGIGIKWGFPAGAEDTQRTELWYSEGTELGLATKLADLSYPQNEYVMQGLRAGQRFYFWARLVDRSGNIGPFFPVEGTLVSGMASADASAILEQIKDQITESELGQELTKRIDLIDTNGPGSVNERLGEVRSDLDQQIADTNNAVAEVDSALTAAKDSLTEAQASLSEALAEAQSDLQEQIDQIADLADSMPYKPDQAYTAGQGVLGEDGKLYQAKGNVPAGNPPPNATYWTDIGQAVQTANGLAVRVQTVETKVQTLEGTTTAQSQQITGLQSSLTTTNGNVTSAQQAAQAASDLAGSKGKVIVQATAPAAADRIAQNLWIDTTGNANTPKRWNGSAWVAVTDKVASDAAAAAANALAVAQTKADANAVQSLTTRVTNVEGVTTAQGQSLTGLQSSLTTTNQNVSAAQAAADAANTLAGGKGKVIVQSAAPAVADRLAQNLWIDTTGSANTPKRWNGSAWVAVTDKVATDAAAAAANALAVAQTKADVSAVQSLTTKVTDVEGVVTAQGQSLTGLQSSLTTTNQNATAAQQAAQDAAALAGGKGKVIVQSAAPAVADRLAQNLWIDTTNNANTPKRWSGSAWVVVTDKVATDAAAAAANALAVAQTKADASAVQSLTTRVADVEGTVTAQGQSLVSLQSSLTTTNQNVTAAQQAAQAAATAAGGKGEVIYGTAAPAADKRLAQNLWIDTTGNANTPKRWNGSAWVAVTDKVATDAAAAAANALSVAQTKADASAVQSLTSRVTDAEGTLSSQGQAITGLSSSLTTTNQNVTAAQQAAQAASDAAGAKGKVLYQSTTPAVADRLTQNLWIDTTSNANTPKRWNGSAWVAVTDKVATDAASAAASALSQVATKADASAVTALNTRMTNAEGKLDTQATSITNLTSSIKAANSAGGNTIPNASFDPAYTQMGMTVFATADASVPAGCPFKYAARLATRDHYPALVDVPFSAVKPGDVWRLSALVACGTGTAPFNLYIQVGTDPATILRTGTGGGQVAATASWTRTSWDYTVPAGVYFIRPFLQIEQAAGGGTVWYATDWHMEDITVAKGAQATADTTASAVTALTTRVASAEGKVASQATSITNLQTSLTTTNNNVTAAQDAAQAASDLAGGKGKVIYGSAAPGTADRQSQNLWIDTTGNANTPKRWNGSAWVAVTDKVATDAAAAAATALAVAQTKADASAVQSLSNTVEQQGAAITANGAAITNISASLGQVAGENLVYNSSFEKESSTPGVADGWVFDFAGGTRVYSLVNSTVAPGVAQRVDLTGMSSTIWCRLASTSNRRVSVDQGIAYTASMYIRAAAGLQIKPQINGVSSTGAAAGTWQQALIVATGDWQKLSVTFTPLTATVEVQICAVVYGSATVSSGFMEVDQVQVEVGSTATGWRDNGQVNATAIGAVSTTVDGLSSTVSQQGTSLTSVSSRTTVLENKVNSTTDGLATKASTSAVNNLSGRVDATEQSLTSQAQSVTALTASVKAANSAGGNIIPNATFDPAFTRMGFTAVATTASGVPAGCPFKHAAQLSGRDHNPALADVPFVAVKPGDVWRLTALAACGAGTAPFNLYIQIGSDPSTVSRTGTGGGRLTTTSAWTRSTWDYTVPAGVYFIRPFLQIEQAAGAGTVWYATDWHMEDVSAAKAAQATADATATALSSTQTTVTQQGDKLTAETQRIDGLYTSVGNANAAIQNEATARANADSTLSQQIQTTQSSLGDTNASVQQISTAQTGLNNRVNAQFSIKVAVTQSGVYALGGIGVGIQNQNGVLQSVVAVLADRFAVINAAGDGFVSPFAVQGGQVFMNDAFVRDASITNAKIANAAITSAKIGVAEVDTLRIRGNAVTVPVAATSAGNVVGGGVGQWRDLIAVGVQMDEAGYITAQYSCYQGFGSGIRKYQFRMEINGLVIAEGGGDWADGFPNLMGSIGVGVGYFVITVKWWGENSGVNVQNHTLYAMGTKR